MYTAHTFMRCYRSNQADIRDIQWKHIVTAASQLYLRRSVIRTLSFLRIFLTAFLV